MAKAREWVIDTCVIEEADNPLSDQCLESLSLLLSILKTDNIAVDFNDEIIDEYQNHMPFNAHSRQWWNAMMSQHRIVFRAGSLAQRHRTHLISSMGFDTDDMAFVAVAAETPDKLLVSIDSDYSAPIVSYLAANLQITFLDITSASQIF